MLLSGMNNDTKKINIKRLCLLIAIGVLITFIFFSCKNKSNSFYQEKITKLLDTSDTVTLSDIFDFDFDCVYSSEPIYESYWEQESFLKKLNVETDINLYSLDYESRARLLFIKDDTIIYDFKYDILMWEFSETGIFLYPETELTFGEKNDFGKAVIQINTQE